MILNSCRPRIRGIEDTELISVFKLTINIPDEISGNAKHTITYFQ